ncbi:hypothetical protein [Fodinibius halophilus]|uniref:Uncharacterized protein n=1 Tax=Fodinibius halophilus TaxID=1736908 RepID=A0A6M1TA72_9BACT|nr:hypothetical protein [Fodinibius halophilus]NGP88941.1 hypothetical protein [Fodinibius halophilus]
MNLDELKSDWQSMDKPSTFEVDSKQFKKMINYFEQIQQKTRKENIIMSILFVLSIAFLWAMYSFMNNASWWVWSGVSILSVEMVAAAVFAWYRNTGKKWKQLRRESQQYLSLAIRKLKYRKFLMLVIIPIYTLLLIVAINLIYIDVLSDLRLLWRWAIHCGVSVVLAGFVGFEIRRRYRREQQEITPLIDEFEAIKEGMD